MDIEKALDNILDMPSKVKILRLFASKREDYIAGGREIARRAGISPPAAHAALKDLHGIGVLKRAISGRQHLYSLNTGNRNVKTIILPAFRRELSTGKDIIKFLMERVKFYGLENKILSLVIYGSFQRKSLGEASDIDICVVASENASLREIEDIFVEKISAEFYDCFAAHLDAYIKSRHEFLNLLKKNLPPVSTLLKSYDVVLGEDPVEMIKK
jgi:predicted nucleotidyltransferase